MRYFHNIFCIPLTVVILMLCACSKKDNIIPKQEMTRIIGEMYIADQYIERKPELRAQIDTLILYEAVTNRYGYTIEDFRISVEYYLQKGSALKDMHLKARKQILAERDILRKQLETYRKELPEWWVSDSLLVKHVNSLWKEPYLRNIKWIANLSSEDNFNIKDTTAFDTPENPIWWKYTINLNSEKSAADSLYPILLRDYKIWRDNNPEEDKTSKKTVTPEFLKFKRRQEMEAKKLRISKNKKKLEK